VTFIPLFFAIPLAAAFIIPILGKIAKSVIWIFVTLVSFALFILALYGAAVTQQFPMIVYEMGNWPPPLGIVMAFDSLSAFMVLGRSLQHVRVS
jgi:formate hydrogenlyase subunit 3/multisubunit Na+/H+ antiporter MnhD subunit